MDTVCLMFKVLDSRVSNLIDRRYNVYYITERRINERFELF